MISAFFRRTWRGTARLVLALLFAGGVVMTVGWLQARRDPLTRQMGVRLPRWPAGKAPLTILVWSDLHLGNGATDRPRLRRLVTRADALNPDLVILAGDYVAGHRREDAAPAAAMLTELNRLRAPLGVVAIMGNHEYWTDAPAVREALGGAGVTVLENGAVRRGPLAVGGIDDMVNARADIARTAAAVRRLGGAPLVISHSPDLAPRLPADLPLLVAGHSHCGQIVLPLLGPIVEVTRPRYRCGAVREGGRLTIVSAGTGTSVVPLRFGAPPDWWLLTLGP